MLLPSHCVRMQWLHVNMCKRSKKAGSQNNIKRIFLSVVNTVNTLTLKPVCVLVVITELN